jgi:hypothetical protein
MQISRLTVSACLLLLLVTTAAAQDVDFNRDVRSILADKCYKCHGPDAKEVKGGLRLDLHGVVTKPADSGKIAIVPGKPTDSELVRRITSDDDSERMPPKDSHKELTPVEIKLLTEWVAQGAEYKDHWAFLPPDRPALPPVENMKWIHNAIDRFALARLEAQQMAPSGDANRETLIRRVSLDLRGFPPSIRELDEFLQDESPEAYEQMVDRMLASPHFGEKMARIWMDLARYGDTNGFHYDSTRQVWLWRNWVIRAYNNNMPFSQFTIEQLAGDLLPDATVPQRVASGFNRNTRYNEEGGADPEEWRVEYAKDRTRTLGQIWLGMTIGCAECHSHKYDPISQKEFYQFYAFFNSLDEPGAQGHRQKYPPLLEVPTDEQNLRIADLQAEITDVQKRIREDVDNYAYVEPKEVPAEAISKPVDIVWIDDETPKGAKPQGQGSPAWQWITKKDGPVHHGAKSTRRSGTGLSQHFFTDAAKPLVIEAGDVLFAWVWLDLLDSPKTVQLQFNNGSWEHRAYWGEPKGYGGAKESPSAHKVGDLPKSEEWVRLEVPAKDVGLKPGDKINGWAFTQFDGTVYYDHAGVTRIEPDTRHLESLAAWEKKAAGDKAVPDNVRNIIKVPADKRNDAQSKTLRDYYVEHVFAETRDVFDPLHAQVKTAQAEIKKTQEQVPFQLVSVELNEPRPAHMLIRGEFNKPGDKVEREVPEVFPGLPEDAPRNRLGLAQWLVTGDHPLTARVAVNRYWAQLFGGGIVETIGDFGTIGRFPTHPRLIDWLAVEFVESGWDTKHIMKLMVMSATYRQSSVNDHRYDEVDPDVRLLWRAPRFRLPAEEIRDSALRVSGMLSARIGGPPVFPFQPEKYYDGKKGGWGWSVSQNEDRYRRGLYTFWRRTTPYPTFVIFDAPDRTECIVARARTNTPLQALVTMNDPQFVEAARVFAQQLLEQDVAGPIERLRLAFRRTVCRLPTTEETAVLKSLLDHELKHFGANSDAASSLIMVGAWPQPKGLDTVEHAAWTAVANALLNLDETITRE